MEEQKSKVEEKKKKEEEVKKREKDRIHEQTMARYKEQDIINSCFYYQGPINSYRDIWRGTVYSDSDDDFA